MRNLYTHLNLSPSATNAQIYSAINTCSDATLKSDATSVLLNPGRRKAFDQLNNTLKTIGELRGQLGLSRTDGWRGAIANEYSKPSDGVQSEYQSFCKKLHAINRKANVQSSVNSAKSMFIRLLKFTGLIGGLILAIWAIDNDSQQSKSRKSTPPPPVAKPAFSQPVMALPWSGATRYYTSAVPLAPFEIITSQGANYLVKLQNYQTGLDVLDVFVRAGETVEIQVPLGQFEVKYASGDTWYGYGHLFGPNTQYSKADSIFNFRQVGNQLSGYTITLYRVSNGNLETTRIGADQF